jgi:hypothetical protein
MPSATPSWWAWSVNCAGVGRKVGNVRCVRFLRTIIRKPSCLISCTHPAPAGGFAAGLGRQGSEKSVKATRRNNMARINEPARAGRVESNIVCSGSPLWPGHFVAT